MIYSDALLVLVTGALPLAENGAIPLAASLGFSAPAAYALGVIGNILPMLPLLYFLKYGSKWAMEHIPVVRRILEWVFARTRAKHGHTFETIEFWGLVAFMAIPLPLTGAWTAAAIAYLIDMPIKKAFFAILIGVLVASLIVLGATFGIKSLF